MFCTKFIPFIFVIFLAYPGLNQAKIYRTVACEGHHLKMSCFFGVIKVLDASYGRRNESICYYFSDPQPNFKACESPYAPSIIRSYCEGQTSCALRAKNANFQDPCPGQIKYADALYTCVSKDKLPQFTGKLQHLNL